MRRPFRTRVCFYGCFPRVCTLGWYAMPPQGMRFEIRLGHETRNAVGPRYRKRDDGPTPGTRQAHGIGNAIVHFALNGHRIPAQGIALTTPSERIGVF
jgi:hypothetical protein